MQKRGLSTEVVINSPFLQTLQVRAQELIYFTILGHQYLKHTSQKTKLRNSPKLIFQSFNDEFQENLKFKSSMNPFKMQIVTLQTA